jgi:hypothetical protein
MPYIDTKRRQELLAGKGPKTPGELNYLISYNAHLYLSMSEDWGYTLVNETYGAMMAAAAEFYRTVVAPYEDKKRKINGSVSAYDVE